MSNRRMYLKSVLTTFGLFLFIGGVWAQAKVQWLTWEEALNRSKVEKRKFFVDVYTDWCGWCKKMDVSTFQNPDIAEYINKHYYPIKFNAEQREDINLKDKVYKFVRNGKRGYHELAVEITYGRLSYPTIVVLDENAEVIQPIPGYKDPEMMGKIISYFAEDHFKKTPWNKYTKRASFNRN